MLIKSRTGTKCFVTWGQQSRRGDVAAHLTSAALLASSGSVMHQRTESQRQRTAQTSLTLKAAHYHFFILSEIAIRNRSHTRRERE
jgi:hypothetical protein